HLSSGKSEGQFVFTSEQFISTCNVQPCAALLATGVGEVRRRTQSQAGHTVWFAIQVQQFQFRVIVGVIEIQGGFPAIGETVDEVQELVFIGGGPAGPVRPDGLRAWPVGARAIAVPCRQTAPRGRRGIVVLIAGTQPQQRTLPNVAFHYQIADALAIREIVGVRFSLLVVAYSASPDGG